MIAQAFVAVEEHLGGQVDYGQIVKVFGPETVDSERRYSPPAIISAEKVTLRPSLPRTGGTAELRRRPWACELVWVEEIQIGRDV